MFRLISVPLYNNPADLNAYEDEIGVATSWQLPGVFAGNPPDALAQVQAKIDSADWGYDPRSGDWAGKVTFPRFGGRWIKRLGALPVRG